MASNRSPEFKDVLVHIVCVVEIQFESTYSLTNITAETTCQGKVKQRKMPVLLHFFAL